MKRIKVGILGYGNLGKSVESIISNDQRFKLVAIFSRRNVKARFAPVDFSANLSKYKGKIDVMFLCGGSSSNLMQQAQDALKLFNCIDAFDTHKKISQHIKNCNLTAKQNQKVAFCSIGWDPGLFSLMRTLFNAIGYKTFTAWGKGVSQGHSEAIRCIKGVNDAVQYTVPNEKLIKQIKNNEYFGEINDKSLHTRECYVVAHPKNRCQIVEKILNMPNYFKGYKTKISFIDEIKMQKHKKLFHAGEVFTCGDELNFKLKTDSNPTITAKIMVAYSTVLFNYYKAKKFGAYSILDIPFSHLINDERKYI